MWKQFFSGILLSSVWLTQCELYTHHMFRVVHIDGYHLVVPQNLLDAPMPDHTADTLWVVTRYLFLLLSAVSDAQIIFKLWVCLRNLNSCLFQLTRQIWKHTFFPFNFINLTWNRNSLSWEKRTSTWNICLYAFLLVFMKGMRLCTDHFVSKPSKGNLFQAECSGPSQISLFMVNFSQQGWDRRK